MKRMRHRKIKTLDEGHTVRIWYNSRTLSYLYCKDRRNSNVDRLWVGQGEGHVNDTPPIVHVRIGLKDQAQLTLIQGSPGPVPELGDLQWSGKQDTLFGKSNQRWGVAFGTGGCHVTTRKSKNKEYVKIQQGNQVATNREVWGRSFLGALVSNQGS